MVGFSLIQQEKNGRGAYIKLDNEEALKLKETAFNHSFSMDVPESFMMNSLLMWIHKVKRRELGLE